MSRTTRVVASLWDSLTRPVVIITRPWPAVGLIDGVPREATPSLPSFLLARKVTQVHARVFGPCIRAWLLMTMHARLAGYSRSHLAAYSHLTRPRRPRRRPCT